jgi:heme oxygenase
MVELCNFFVPLESPSNDIYSHIKNSFYLVKKISFLSRNLTEKIKILSIIKFLNLTGYYYTEQIKEALTLFDRLSVLFIDFNNIQKLEFLELQADILPWEYYNKWIIHSLQQHPCFNFFKTVGFLYRGDPW